MDSVKLTSKNFAGFNYYSVYKKNQLKKELDKYETHLMELDQILRTGKPATIG